MSTVVDNQCKARPVKAYIVSDLLSKLDLAATNDVLKVLVVLLGFFLVEYVDTEYSLWLTWVLTPVVVTFLLPAVIIVLIYVSSVIYHVYRLYRHRIVDGAQSDWRQAALLTICALWDAHGWLWHGYEIRGLENLPAGPFLLIYYHGALPVDMYYFTARLLLTRATHLHTVADRFMFRIPGWAALLDALCVIPGTVQECAAVLRAGNPLAIAPGGVYEAQFGDHNYKLFWKSRYGFAKVALEAKVPIVPMFTANVREAFRTVGWLRGACLRVYAATRVPLAPVYGGFPVKLVTHLGPPLRPDPADTPQQLQRKVARAVESLIEEHQRIPGNIFYGLLERVWELPKHPKTKAVANGVCQNGGPRSGASDKDGAREGDSAGDACERDSAGDACERDSAGDACERDSAGDACERDSAGDACERDSAGDACERDSAGDACERDSAGDACERDTAGDACERDSAGDACERDTAGDACERDIAGDACERDSAGDACDRDSAGDASADGACERDSAGGREKVKVS